MSGRQLQLLSVTEADTAGPLADAMRGRPNGRCSRWKWSGRIPEAMVPDPTSNFPFRACPGEGLGRRGAPVDIQGRRARHVVPGGWSPPLEGPTVGFQSPLRNGAHLLETYPGDRLVRALLFALAIVAASDPRSASAQADSAAALVTPLVDTGHLAGAAMTPSMHGHRYSGTTPLRQGASRR